MTAPAYCARCVLPDTRPGVRLDAEGVCRGCRNWETKPGIDWAARSLALDSLVADARARGADHDCVIPVSGGKDSYWQVVTCLERGLRPLCVTYAHPGRTAHGEANLRNLVAIGVDHLELRLDAEVERAFVTKAFQATATSGLVTHMAIYAWPVRVAIDRGIPLVVYGENSAFEYGSEDDSLDGPSVDRRWLERFGVTAGTTVADWLDGTLTAESLAPLQRPTDEEIERAGVRVVFLGHYVPWDPESSRVVAVRHGFEARPDGPRVGHYDYVNIDDDLIGVHHHAKWYKFGITRSWDTLSMEIRAGRATRDDAIEALRQRGPEVPWPDVDAFCAYTGMTEAAYFDTLERFRNQSIWTRADGEWRIEGFLLPDFPWPDAPVPRR